jgi:hypothetical protein
MSVRKARSSVGQVVNLNREVCTLWLAAESVSLFAFYFRNSRDRLSSSQIIAPNCLLRFPSQVLLITCRVEHGKLWLHDSCATHMLPASSIVLRHILTRYKISSSMFPLAVDLIHLSSVVGRTERSDICTGRFWLCRSPIASLGQRSITSVYLFYIAGARWNLGTCNRALMIQVGCVHVYSARVRTDRAPHHQERRVQLRSGAAGAPHRAAPGGQQEEVGGGRAGPLGELAKGG